MVTGGAPLVLRAAPGAFAPSVRLADRSASVVVPVHLVLAQPPSVVAVGDSVAAWAASAVMQVDLAVAVGGAAGTGEGAKRSDRPRAEAQTNPYKRPPNTR